MNVMNFTDNQTAQNDQENYVEINVDAQKILKSYALSVYSFEWLDKKGKIKPLKDIKESDQKKRETIENAIKNGLPVSKSILGIGLYDNVEIGSGRAEFLTLAANGFQTIPVHIRKSQQEDFKAFLADVS